jgi:recombination protein RecA
MEKKQKLTLDEIKKQLEKDFGKGTIISAVDKEPYGDVIPSTSFSFNRASGIGGLPKGKLVEIYGDTGSYKSTTAYDIIANCQKEYDDYCLLIDMENSYSTEYGSILNIDNEKLLVSNNNSGKIESLEDMYDVLEKAIESGMFGVIVVDSVTSFAPKARMEGSVVMGLEARVNSDKMRLINKAVNKSNTLVIMINQVRNSIGGYGSPVVTSGGKAIGFYSHMRIWNTRSEIDKDNENNVVKFNFIKNKMGVPFKIGNIVFNWKTGFDVLSEIVEIAIESNIIQRNKNTYTLPNTEEDLKLTSRKKLDDYLDANKDVLHNVIQPLVENYLNNKVEVVSIDE